MKMTKEREEIIKIIGDYPGLYTPYHVYEYFGHRVSEKEFLRLLKGEKRVRDREPVELQEIKV